MVEYCDPQFVTKQMYATPLAWEVIAHASGSDLSANMTTDSYILETFEPFILTCFGTTSKSFKVVSGVPLFRNHNGLITDPFIIYHKFVLLG